MEIEAPQRRTLRPRGTRVVYGDDDFGGAHSSGSEGESSASGAAHMSEDDVGGRPGQSRYFDEEDDDSEDEWQPEGRRKKPGKTRRARRAAADHSDSASDSDEEAGTPEDEELAEDEVVAAARKKRRRNQTDVNGRIRKPGSLVQGGEQLSAGAAAAERHKSKKIRHGSDASSRPDTGAPGRAPKAQDVSSQPTTITELEPPSDDDGIDHQAEAARLWKDVQARKAGGAEGARSTNGARVQNGASAAVNKAPGGLDGWLGVEPPAWPTTCADAMINDRDSLFVGFVYALNSSSQSEITRCLSHLTKVVQPQAVPQIRLPPAMRHLAPTRRGATHDMFAWRCLALKRGRTGLGGPEDFGLEEGQEDDGEKFGAKEIAKVIRMYGATDVLVVVSRWYGGTMLGPARFRHIEESAKAALGQHMVNEAMADLLTELRRLDGEIAAVKAKRVPASQDSSSAATKPAATYTDLDPERAQRLVTARRKQLEMLKRAESSRPTADDVSQASETRSNGVEPPLDPPIDAELDEAEEAAALEAMAEAEAEAEAVARSSQAQREPSGGQGNIEEQPDATNTVQVKAEPQDAAASPRPAPYVKPEPDARTSPSPTRAGPAFPRVKPEPVDHDANIFSPAPPSPAPPARPAEPRVKDEPVDDEADLTGWDELS